MALVTDFKRLTEDMLASYDERMGFVSNLAKDTAELLEGFRKELTDVAELNRQMATEVKEQLGAIETERLNEFKDFIKGIHDRQKIREEEVRSLLNSFKTDFREMSDAWHTMSLTMKEKRMASAGR